MSNFFSISKQNDNQSSHAVSRKEKVQTFFKPLIQPKLTIGPVDDPYEREADAVAEKVMRISDTETLQTKPSPLTIQRKCAACEEEENVQMKGEGNASGGMIAPPVVHDVINSPGQKLDAGTRDFMESRFGYDFGNVQIHNNSLAHRSSKNINALAYTHGTHVVFGDGHYQPNTNSGKQLLAHELAHVVQQGKTTTPDSIYRKVDKPNAGKKIVKIIAFKGQLDGQAVLSDGTVVSIGLTVNTLIEPGTYIYNLDEGAEYHYRHNDGETRPGGILWKSSDVFGNDYKVVERSEIVTVEIIEGDQLIQQDNIEALPEHIKNFLTKGEGKVASYKQIQDTIDAGWLLAENDVTEDELLLYEIEQQRKKEQGGDTEVASASEWANEFVSQRQNNVDAALTNRELFDREASIAENFTAENKEFFGFSDNKKNADEITSLDLIEEISDFESLLDNPDLLLAKAKAHSIDQNTLNAIVTAFEFELRANTNAFLSNVLLTLLKMEKRFITDSSSAGVGLDRLEAALKPLKLALEQKEKALYDYANLEVERYSFTFRQPSRQQKIILDWQIEEAKDEFEVKSKYLLELAESVKLPILNMRGFDIKALIAEKTASNKQGLLKSYIADSRTKIEEMQEMIKDSEFLYKGDKMVAFTKDNLKIKKNSFVDTIINDKIKIATDEGIWGDILDIASILSIFIPGGLGVFIRLGLSTVSMGREFQIAGEDSALFQAGTSSKDSSSLASVLAAGGLMFDAGDAVKGVLKLAGAGADVATDAATRVAVDGIDDGAAKAIGKSSDDVVIDVGLGGGIRRPEDSAATTATGELDAMEIGEGIGTGDMGIGLGGHIRGIADGKSSTRIIEGISDEAALKIKDISQRENLFFSFRPVDDGVIRLRELGHPPKPEFLKMKTIKQLDVELGANAADIDKVGFYVPVLPANFDQLPIVQQKALEDLYEARIKEGVYLEELKEWVDAGLIKWERGVIVEVKSGLAFTGDYDLYEIRIGGKGGKSIKFEELEPEIQTALRNEGIEVQHGALTDWEIPEGLEEAYKSMMKSTRGAHAKKPLVEINPDGTITHGYSDEGW